MSDIRLEILSPDKEVQSVDAPEDMRAGDFLADLVEELGLKGVGWRLYDKDLQRELDADTTLADNGVRAGHHLYFRPPAPPPVVPPPPPPVARWFWVVPAAASLLLGLTAGYLLRGHTPDPAAQEMRRQLDERGRIVAQLQAELKESSKSVDEKLQSIQANLAAKVADNDNLKQQADRLKADSQSSRHRIGELLAQVNELKEKGGNSQNLVKDAQAQAAAAKARADQSDAQLARSNQDLQTAKTELRALQLAQGRGGRAVATSPSVGVLIWRGKLKKQESVGIIGHVASLGSVVRGSLPSALCVVEAGDPDHVEILERPSQQNGYRLLFRRRDSGDSNTLFLWVLAPAR